MNLPIPSGRNFFDLIYNIIKIRKNKKTESDIKCWKHANLNLVYQTVTNYYRELEPKLFSYTNPSSGRFTMPLYVENGWDNLSLSKLKMHFDNNYTTFRPNKSQNDFWMFYRRLNKLDDFDHDIFNLNKIEQSEDFLKLNFDLSKFSYSVMNQYILEHELVLLLANNNNPPRSKFRRRNKFANNFDSIINFINNNVTRIGICNLILLRENENNYIPIVHKRAELSMVQHSLFDPVSSCIFELMTTAKADFKLLHTILREISEELFGYTELERKSKSVDPYFFYSFDGINDLKELLDNRLAIFDVTGFCIDLIRIVPEITTVLIVKDAEYFRKHSYTDPTSKCIKFCLNEEFDPISKFRIPTDINNVDKFLKEQLVSDPDDQPPKTGFDPLKWTLAGGFCFYQGLKRVVEKNLLK